MQATLDKRTAIIRQGQRVFCGLHGGKYGIVIGILGGQRPETVQPLGSGVTMGGHATFDVAFDEYISRGLPECILRGVQWEIFDSIATADEIIDAVQRAKDAEAMKKLQETAAADRRQAEREEHAKNPAFAHLLKKTDRPDWHGGRLSAENIRRELKRVFPGEKFSVKSDYSSVDIRWDNGPTTDEVEAVTKRHQMGSFNGMEDIYEYSADRTFADVFGGVRYVSCHRSETLEAIREAFAKMYPNGLSVFGGPTFKANDLNEERGTAWYSRSYDETNWIRRAWAGTSWRKGKIISQKDV